MSTTKPPWKASSASGGRGSRGAVHWATDRGRSSLAVGVLWEQASLHALMVGVAGSALLARPSPRAGQ